MNVCTHSCIHVWYMHEVYVYPAPGVTTTGGLGLRNDNTKSRQFQMEHQQDRIRLFSSG